MRTLNACILGATLILVGLVFKNIAHATLGRSTSELSGSVDLSISLAQGTTSKIEWEVQGEQFFVYLREPSRQRRLVLRENALVMHSALIQLSPDGRQIAFVTAGDLGFRDATIWLINSDGSERRKLVGSGIGFWVTNPVWSPDSRQLAYVTVLENLGGELAGTRLGVADLATSKVRQLVTDEAFKPVMIAGMAQSITWSAQNGLRFSSDGRSNRLYQIDLMTGTLKEIERVILPSSPAARDCQNMIKPVNVRDYDGRIDRLPGYTTGYLDKYTYTDWDGLGSHPGVDIAGGGVGAGTEIRAVAEGNVRAAGWSGGWGNLVVLRHDGSNCPGPVYSIYAHMQSAPSVSGDIGRGTIVGRVGSTGNSSGPHLHFQIDKDNTSHPFWPSRSGQCQTCSWDNPNHVVNNPDTDNQVKSRTHDPMRFIQNRTGGGQQQQTCADGEGVILYEHSNFQGRCTRFTGDDSDLGNDSIGNDAASSIRIIGNFEATLYEHSNYGGTSSIFTNDDSDLGNDSIGHDRASSIRVRRRDAGGNSNCDGGQGVYLYEHSNYSGRCSKFTGDSSNPRGWYVGNDAASSIRIIGNYEATVYEHDDYNGASSHFTGNDPDFGNDTIGHDRASSIRVRPRSSGGTSNCDGGEGVYLYEHSNYQGRCSKFTGDSPNPSGWYVGNDQASSIRVIGNYEATVYEHDNYNGASSTFSSDDPDFGNDVIGHDRASSIRVRPRSSGPTSCPDGQFLAEYFNNRNLSGNPTFRRCESNINTTWGYDGPGSGVGNDNFSVRWSGQFWFDEGTYRFATRTDDGVRFWLDHQLIIDQWRDMGATEFTSDRALSAGMHTLRVEYYESSGYATARLSWQRQQIVSDPDDGRTIGYDQGLDGTVSPAHDRDDYYFEGSAGQAITLRMDKRESNLDSYVELYNPDGSLLGQDDDSGGNYNSRLSITLRQNGRHKIIARGYGSSTGGYRLSLARESTADPDDNRWIALGSTLQGTISPNNDRDWYYFSATSGRVVSIRMAKIDSGLDSYIELYDDSGYKIGENDDGGGDLNSWLVTILPRAGVYRILARSYNLSSSGRYNLSLNLAANVNLARGKPVWATSTESNGVEPYKACDGNNGTRWSSQFSDPQFIYVDLGSTVTFDQVVLRWEAAYARRYGVYYWTGNQWRNVYWTDNGDGGNDTITFSPVQARFVGVYGVQRGTQYGYSLWEIEVYNTANVVTPIVPPDPGDKPPDRNLDPLVPLPPNEPDKVTALIGEGPTGQENMPTAGAANTEPTSASVNAGIPTAWILYPIEGVPIDRSQPIVLFQGTASDNDEDGQSIVAYEWRSDRDGLLSTEQSFTRPAASLSVGQHVISFRAQDNEGNWSEWAQVTIQVNPATLYLPFVLR